MRVNAALGVLSQLLREEREKEHMKTILLVAQVITDMRKHLNRFLIGITMILASAVSAGLEGSRDARAVEVQEFADFILETHPNAANIESREEWQAALDELERVALEGSDEAYLVALMQLLATVRDGHTTMPIMHNVGEGRFPMRLPIRLRPFHDGIYVIAAKDEAMPLLGARVTAMGGLPINAVMERFETMWPADNVAAIQAGASWLGMPAFLAGLGITDTEDAPLMITAEGASGPVEATLQPRADAWPGRVTVERSMFRQELWRDEAGSHNYLRRLRDERALYLYLGMVGDTETLSFSDLTDQVATALEETGYDRLVIDLRDNGGGDNTLSERLRRVVATSRYNEPGRLIILTSPLTFSAAVNIAARFERDTFPIFVGEPTGEGANLYGDTESLSGSATGMAISVSALRWQDSVPFDERVWIMPDVYVPRTYEEWIAGHDKGLEVALTHETDLGESDPQWFSMWARASQAETWVPFWRR